MEDEYELVCVTNSYAFYQMVPLSMTLSDL